MSALNLVGKLAAVAVGSYALRATGTDVKIVNGIQEVGRIARGGTGLAVAIVTDVASLAVGSVMAGGCLIADTAIGVTRSAADVACAGAENVAAGLQNSARFVTRRFYPKTPAVTVQAVQVSDAA